MTAAPRGRDHDRARSLAAGRVDEPLAPADAAWLDAHLATCPACAADAAAYEADRAALRGLRTETFEAPRDLWARTAAAIESEGGRGVARRGRLGRPFAALAPIAGLAVVAIVVGSGLLNGQPVAPVGPEATPIAFAAGTVAVLNVSDDGALQLSTGNLHEVCPMTAASCRVEPSFETAPVAGFRPSQDVNAVISPTKDQLVVIPRGSGGTGGVYVVPVKRATPQPSPEATTAPSTPAVTEAPTATPETPTASPSEPAESPSATESPSETPGESPAESPAESPEASPVESPSTEPASPEATPEATATPETTEEPTATPVVAVTPRPDGALEIASGVVVVDGPATYSPDGTRFAFTARPADGSTGPDVYVWNTDDTVARAITDDHRSVFAGWDGDALLVSRANDAGPVTLRLDAGTGEVRGDRVRGAWMPSLSPDGDHAVWWDGTVKLAADGLTWVPAEGRLVAGQWPPSGNSAQPIADGRVDAWQVRWDPTGEALAVWVAGRNADAGKLSLYTVDPATGRPDLGSPKLENEPALGGFTLEPGMLAWSAPGRDAGTTVQVLAWKGDTIGRAELPADGDTTLVQQ